ncbi:PREDICTED: probable fucosyltransferase 7 [Camelina sativa]|uniref:Fucosyltransferase n=1 Tax=Camelina sativa TaxID=90675 RepID=A0ABM0WUP4_CAMSA|nr:PREDICTED: probable fucosyltransferase 7 [Camelina sativa]
MKMKLMITTILTCLLLWSLMLLSFSNIFKHQLLGATTVNVSSKVSVKPRDKLLGGLLTADFDEDSCLSRYQSSLYRKPSPYNTSQYLVSKLRNYEMLHKRCGPGTDAYKIATKKLGHDHNMNVGDKSVGECKYIVWVAVYGLGNRILTLASVFLYALLTDRIILVDQRKDISDLFCEPFPGTSWLLPLDFPLMGKIDSFDREYSRCHGTMLKNHTINSTTIPSHLYLHLLHDYRDQDQRFFCQKDHSLVDKVPWLVVKSNLYFIPSLWLNPSFQPELIKLFPQKDTVFYHLARYLFHPTNQVWGMVTRSYNAYLSRADEILGIQVRVFSRQTKYFQHVMNQIVACTQREKLLPETAAQEESQVTNTTKPPKLKAVLVTSLNPGYSNNLKNMYWERPTSTGEIVKVYQPSGERFQQTDKKLHDQKALAEMYLLSLTDKLVTSAWSTFGYVAQGLGGLKPWILYTPKKFKTPDPPCGRGVSMEPCFLTPPAHGCGAKKGINTAKIVPFVRYCEDLRHYGLKLVGDTKDEL